MCLESVCVCVCFVGVMLPDFYAVLQLLFITPPPSIPLQKINKYCVEIIITIGSDGGEHETYKRLWPPPFFTLLAAVLPGPD